MVKNYPFRHYKGNVHKNLSLKKIERLIKDKALRIKVAKAGQRLIALEDTYGNDSDVVTYIVVDEITWTVL